MDHPGPHKIAIVVTDDFMTLDVAIACDMFSMITTPEGGKQYEVKLCAADPAVDNGRIVIAVAHDLSCLRQADTVIIPGFTAAPPATFDESLLDAIRQAAARGARIASICTGTFLLAATGLLNGLRATTHWEETGLLAERYPGIEVEPDVLFVDNDSILTSAGVASGIDLCLHMIRKDCGALAAEIVARFIVVPIERDGRQAQLLKHTSPRSASNLGALLLWIMENIHLDLRIEKLCERAGMSPRTLNRHFHEQTGTTPLQWILTARIRRAQQLLESTDLSIEHIATAAGFESAATFRSRFLRVVGVTPTAWRRTYTIKNEATRTVKT